MADQHKEKEIKAKVERYTSNPVIATVDGKAIHLNDIMNKTIHDLLEDLYEELAATLPQTVLKELAKKHKGIELKPATTVTDKEVEAFYKQNNLQQRGTLQQLKGQIKQYLVELNNRLYLAQQFSVAMEKGWVYNYLEPPVEFLVTTSTETAVIRNNPKASVMVLEFSDYQCPFCGRIQPTLDSLMDKYKEKVAFAYRHFPLSFHTEADEAAIAAECAREQGKFEEMHKILYQNQRKQHPSDLKGYAKTIKVKNLTKFNQCLDQEKYRKLVQDDIRDGSAIGISGTPGFMIGTYNSKTKKVTGEVLSGALPQSVFEKTIQKYLNKKS
ncbi:MAG: thioredoxin domain-containing protein [SAR324 cluster bacterium]|nr:thioredoxin domain-containing protein [SAR324 cluster bacterium]